MGKWKSREVILPENYDKELKELKKKSGIPVSHHIRTSVKEYLKRKKEMGEL